MEESYLRAVYPLHPILYISICKADEERPGQPKFSFVHDQPTADNSDATKISIFFLRKMILGYVCESCECAKEVALHAAEFWKFLTFLSNEFYWMKCQDIVQDQWTSTETPNEDDFLAIMVRLQAFLNFEVIAWILLKYNLTDSFLHINSGTGYACTIASMNRSSDRWMRPIPRVQGVEFRLDYRHRAKDNVERILRLQPHLLQFHDVPVYHADLPTCLLEKPSGFDRIIITDCFDSLQYIVQLKRFLNPGGCLVTGFMCNIGDEVRTGMVTVYRREGLHDPLLVEEVDNSAQSGTSFDVHRLSSDYFLNVLKHVRDSQLNTASHLEELTAWRNPRPDSESAVPSLTTLAQRICSQTLDPLGPLLGQLRKDCILRLQPDWNMPIFYPKLRDAMDAFAKFRSRCLSFPESDINPPMIRAVKRDLYHLVVAFQELQMTYIGGDQFNKWRNGEFLKVPVLKGVMIWLSENIFSVVGFRTYLQSPCFQLGRLFERPLINDNAVRGHRNEVLGVTATYPLLRAIVNLFRNGDDLFDQQPPWSYQLFESQLIRRIFTRLTARYWSCASVMAAILATMMRHCLVAQERMALYREFVFKLDSYLKHVKTLYNYLVVCHNTFILAEYLKLACSIVTPILHHMNDDVRQLNRMCPDTEEVHSLYACFQCICSSAIRNPVCIGTIRNIIAIWGDGNYLLAPHSMFDLDLFNAERTFLTGDQIPDQISTEDVCAFLARTMLSDMKEAVWIVSSGWAQKWLTFFQVDMRSYTTLLSQVHQNGPLHNFADMFKIFRYLEQARGE